MLTGIQPFFQMRSLPVLLIQELLYLYEKPQKVLNEHFAGVITIY